MKIPKSNRPLLKFKFNNTWYKITSISANGTTTYTLYRQKDEDEYIKLATGQNPQKLEYKVYDGKLK